ncbi:MAG: hypothetical protein ACK49N_01995 [Verrucomicrobiota bacterium]
MEIRKDIKKRFFTVAAMERSDMAEEKNPMVSAIFNRHASSLSLSIPKESAPRGRIALPCEESRLQDSKD